MDFSGSQARKGENCFGESFEDANNNGQYDTGEKYFNEDGNAAYTPTLRQVNFPGQIPDDNRDVTHGADTNNYNRPVVYVRGSHITVRAQVGDTAKSDITGDDVPVGYPVSEWPIYIHPTYNAQFMNGVSGQNGNTNVRAISPAAGKGPYTLQSEATLPNTVHLPTQPEAIEFEFYYNATGETFVDANGNGTYDAGEALTDQNGNGQYDEVMKRIPGHQKTEHRIYTLAAEPTATAKNRGVPPPPAPAPHDDFVFLKIVDFTCDWANGDDTREKVFAKIWDTDKFWTPFVGAAGDKRPNNAEGFHGVGDPYENALKDNWRNSPKCYTYEHDDTVTPDGQTVDELLDINSGRCGGWSKFLPAFAGTHGFNLKPLTLSMMARRERGAAVDFVTYDNVINGGGFAMGDKIYCHADVYEALTGTPTEEDQKTGILVTPTPSGQANPAGNTPGELPGGPPVHNNAHLMRYFNNHAVAFNDEDDDNELDAGEELYDGSYEHPGGLSYADVHARENDAVIVYAYMGWFEVTAINPVNGKITGWSAYHIEREVTPPFRIIPKVFPNDPDKTEMEGEP